MDKVHRKWGIRLALAAISLALVDALFFEKYFFETRRFLIGNKKSSKMLTIVLLTDLHFRKSIWAFHRKLARTVNQIRPHLIIISGDVVDMNGYEGPVKEFFDLLDINIPKAAIFGNHDHL